MLIAFATTELLKKLQKWSHHNGGIQIRQIESIWLWRVQNTTRKGVQTTRYWSEPNDAATDEWLLQRRRDPAWLVLFSVAV